MSLGFGMVGCDVDYGVYASLVLGSATMKGTQET